MKTKIFQITFVAIIALSIVSSLFVGNVSQARAQSSRFWSDPVNLSNSGGATNPILVIDSMGIRNAIWTDESDESGGYRFTQSEDGKTWTAPQKVKYPFIRGNSVLPVLISGPNGSIYIFWQNLGKSLVFAQATSKTLSNPSQWSTKVLSVKALVYDVAQDAQGVIYVAFIRNVDTVLGPAGVYYMRSSNGGKSWTDEKLLYGSQYFRTTKLEDAHVNLVVPDGAGNGRIFVAWDNTAQKRIFMSTSADSGSTWSDVVQLKGPEDTGGYNLPYDVTISIVGDKALMIWKVGEPSSTQCGVYSQWSSDWGVTWSEPATILDYRSFCPQTINFLAEQDDTVITLLSYAQGNPSIMAWHDGSWSTLQIQSEISLFENPDTHEAIMFGCYNYLVNGDQLFLVGCDTGSGRDIWLTSRSILPASNWLFPSSVWSLPNLRTSTSQKIQSMVYVTDQDRLHALWMQYSNASTANPISNMAYSRLNTSEWSTAKNVISGLGGISGDLAAAAGKSRLFLVWSDEKTGNLLFSWSSASKADSSAEWAKPTGIPSPSQWTSSPDMLIDSSGTIVVVYAVPVNEKRGIYLVKSEDNGITWSSPVTVFNAEAAGWVMVNHPKIALTGDGLLHVIFTNYSGLTNQPSELYYLQSLDGGTAWSAPDIVSDGSVVWSDIITADEHTLHRIWQENQDSVVANMDQISTDGGATWGKAINVTGVNSAASPVTLAMNSLGELHFIQLLEEDVPLYLKEYKLAIQDWRWNGEKWESQPYQEINIKGDAAEYSLAAGISAQGFLNVSLIATYRDLKGEVKNEIYDINRSLSEVNDAQATTSAIIPTSSFGTVVAPPTDTQPIPSAESAATPALYGVNKPSDSSKNFIGISLILIVAGLMVFIFLRRAKNYK